MSDNLPPGVNESDIPGNRPEDQEWEDLWLWIAEQGIGPTELKALIRVHLHWRARVNENKTFFGRGGFDERKESKTGSVRSKV